VNLLLDTHIFLWLVGEQHRLSKESQAALADPENQFHLSIVSIWEIQIKIGTGKLQLPLSLRDYVAAHCGHNSIRLIRITEHHIWTLGTLPPHHRDPFDRMLIAQAIRGNFTLVSADAIFAQYPVRLLGRSPQT
jgi:PIN domain nuclease of toxin-antitoxin system